ncbi:MAG: hypothetical protein NTY19_09155 [Planctomycetota bacterium]|nr:hypothetical protein [Planctomycetota bacterium]
MKPVSIYSPENFDAARVLPADLTEYADCARYFVHRIVWGRVQRHVRAEGYVPLKWDYLRKVIPDRVLNRIKAALISAEVIDCDNYYIKGRKAFGYRLVRQTAYERWWVGYALHVLKARLKTKREWTGWQRQQQISRATVWRAIRLYQSYEKPEMIKELPIVEVYRAMKLCPKKAEHVGVVSVDGEAGPIRIKHGGRTIVANSPREAARAVEAITHLPKSCNGRTIDIITAERRARRTTKQTQREARVVAPVTNDDIRMYHCRFQDLETVAGIWWPSPGRFRQKFLNYNFCDGRTSAGRRD